MTICTCSVSQALRNRALKERHWTKVFSIIGQVIPRDSSFTLQVRVSMSSIVCHVCAHTGIIGQVNQQDSSRTLQVFMGVSISLHCISLLCQPEKHVLPSAPVPALHILKQVLLQLCLGFNVLEKTWEALHDLPKTQ